MDQKRLWIFDLDNTLVPNTIDYARPQLDFARLMLGLFGWQAPHILKIFEKIAEIDKARFKEHRAKMERFPGSLVLTYQSLCERVGIAPDLKIENKVYRIGMRAFSNNHYRNQGMIPGAAETLDFLKKRGESLYCVTAGDDRVQWRKWRAYGLKRWFPDQETFRVVPWEKLPEFQHLRRRFPDITGYVVGDSVGSDLVPAKEAGFVLIYVPSFAVWDHGELVEELPEGTTKLDRILEIKDSFLRFRP